jgi:exosortase
MILGLVLISALVYWPSVSALYGAWTDFRSLSYTHGPLIAIACVLLLYRRRRQLESVDARPWPLAFVALLLCSIVWLVCFRASIQDLHILLFPAAIGLAVAAVFGPQVARVTALPLLFFYFASSAWGELSPYLQELTLLVMRGLMAATGMNVTVTGDVIHVPFGTFVVEAGCSGLHFLLVGLAVATLHGELREDPLRLRITHIIVMSALALLANWVRVYTVVRAGYDTHMRHALVSHGHYYFGWMVFAVALAVFFWLARRYSRWFDPVASAGALGTTSGAHGVHLATAASIGRMNLAYTAAVLSMVAAPTLSYALKSAQGAPAAPRIEFESVEDWSGPVAADRPAWEPVFVGADALEQREYRDSAGGAIEALGVAYATQRQGSELIGETNSVTGQSGLEAETEQPIRTAAGRFRETTVTERSGRKWVIWSRFEIAGRAFTMPLAAQLWYGVRSLATQPLAGLVALRSKCLPDCAGARRRLESLARHAPVRLIAGVVTVAAQAREKSVGSRRTGA